MEEIKSRLSAYLKEKKINKSEFGRSIGVSSAYISSMRKSIQPDKLDKISEAYPDLNIVWLLTGEGEMLKGCTNIKQEVGDIYGDAQGVNVHGNVNICSAAVVDKFLDEIAAQRKLVEKANEQIERLIGLLEKK